MAATCFCQALAVTSDDLIATFNLAQALQELDPEEHREEADRLLLQVIEAQPYGERANKIKDLRGASPPATCTSIRQTGCGKTP